MVPSRQLAQGLVLSSGLWNGPAIWNLVRIETMDDGYRQVAQAMKALTDAGKEVSHDTLTAECAKRGIRMGIDHWAMYPIPATEAAAAYLEATARVGIERALLHGAQQLEVGADHWDVVDDVTSKIAMLERPLRTTEPYGEDWPDILALTEVETEWVIPGLVGRAERCVLTGAEGYGKSLLVYQLVLGAAFGVSPLDPDRRFDRQRVLILDVENTKAQIAGHYRTLSATYRHRSGEPDVIPEVRLMRNRYIDLMKVGDRRYLIDAANDFQPDLLYMGSGYRLADGTQDHRQVAMSIQQTVDQIRADVGCACIIEAHAGHGFQGDRNNWRPDGSSYWMRWPEFGLGLEPVKSHRGRLVRLVKWRGDRVTGREWPDGFRSGGFLPWVPVEEAEIELDAAR